MITATIRVGGYPRKSNREEKAEADRKEKSVERQDAELREFVAKQPGWGIVAMYTEDGKSGALGEDGRPAFKRMMDDVRAGRLDVVVMVAPDRLARNQYEAMFAQATFVKHKVRLFYTDGGGREVDLQSSVGRFSSAAEAFGAEFTRESTTKHAVAALKRRAKAGGVVGGTIPGYTNVPAGPGAAMKMITRRIDPAAAVRITRMFALYTQDLLPMRTISKVMGTSKAEVKNAIRRSIYSGRVVSRWRDGTIFESVDESLRIIDEQTWQAAVRRRAADRTLYLRAPDGRLWGKPARVIESRWLLAGMLRCGACGSGLVVITRHQRKEFVCLRHHQGRRDGWCASKLAVPMTTIDAAVLERIVPMIDAGVLKEAHAEALRIVRSRAAVSDRKKWTTDLARVDREVARLVKWITSGRASDAVATALAEAEAKQKGLRDRLAVLDGYAATADRMAETEAATLTGIITRWRAIFADGHVAQLRQLLVKLFHGQRLTVTGTTVKGQRWATFTGAVSLAPLLGGLLLPASSRAVADHLGARTQVSLLPPPWEEFTT
jgi:DNA invertase Pin-like site-specific DNA recombinase